MTKLINFPQQNKSTTWEEAMKKILEHADEETKNKVVKTLLVIGESDVDYSFGLSNYDRIRQLLGTMECVKAYFVMALHNNSDYEYPE